MLRLIKVCFWIAVVVMFLPEEMMPAKGSTKAITAGAIELANKGVKTASEFCVKNPNACLEGQKAAAGISEKTINTARSIYDYLQETSSDDVKNGLEQVVSPTDLLSIEEQIKVAQSKGQTLSVSDLNIDFSSIDVQ